MERGPYFYYIGYTAPQRLFKKYKWALDQVIKTFKFLPDGKWTQVGLSCPGEVIGAAVNNLLGADEEGAEAGFVPRQVFL